MNKERVHYLRCPYCGQDGEHEKIVRKSVGLFRIKELYNNVLILQCQKCLGISRVAKMGSILEWRDMAPAERKAFQEKMLKTYRKDGNKTN